VVNEELARTLAASCGESLVVLDSERRIVALSAKARDQIGDLAAGRRLAEEVMSEHPDLLVLYLESPPELSAYQELRAGFTAAVSHELRTRIDACIVNGENLADGVVHDDAQIRKYGDLVRNEGRRLTEMVEQAPEFAGAQSGRKTYALRPVEIPDLIERALLDCQDKLEEGDFRVEQDIDPDLPQLMADAQSLRRAILNLLNNAIKYSGDQRWITIRAGSLLSRRGPEIRISVQDHGIGIAPEDLPHIFDPFYRGRSVAVSEIHGSGLGLNLVKQIAEAHGGRVSVESTVGQGSTFTLHLYGQPGDESARRAISSLGNP